MGIPNIKDETKAIKRFKEKDMEFRTLNANEIECRVAQVFEGKGITLLLYKNARTDSSILDEEVGCECWQNRFYECKGNLYCSVGIKFGDEWVWKDDCGTESFTEKEKGEASDAFKRACFKWGIGKELYTAPLIYIKAEDIKKWYTNGNGKQTPKDRFRVKHIKTVNGKIEELIIFNETAKTDCFVYGVR